MTELIWKGKQKGRQRQIQAKRAPLPLRTLEILGQPSDGAQSEPDWLNKLIWGDNLYAMASLLEELAGKIHLIYLDPPFATGGNFSINIKLGGGKHRGRRSVIEERAYGDTWNGGLDSYLQIMYERLSLMRDLLADDGSIYVHLDWHAGHYVKILLDEIFGKENFRNEIVWCYRTMQTSKRGWARKHDTILFYTRGERYTFNLKDVLEAYPEDYERRFKYVDDRGRRFMIRGKGGPFGMGQGDISIEDEKRYPAFTYRQYMQRGSIPKDWWEIEMLNSNSQERVGFETQKPEALLERIVKASSRPGDLVMDPFCGSGTLLAVAEKLGRRWIGCDLSRRAIQLSRRRLLNIPGHRAFEVLALGGRYSSERLKEKGIRNHTDFILKLYRAQPLFGHRMIHGEKEGRLVHIGKLDSAVSLRHIRQVAKECASIGRDSVDILGWDFEVGAQDLVDRIGSQYSVQIRLLQIPEQALEVKDGVKAGIEFFEPNRLEVELRQEGKRIEIALKGFRLGNPGRLPKEVRKKLRGFTDYIDYWAVDFDCRGGAFRNSWQSFPSGRHPVLGTECSHAYEKGGNYRIWVKAVDLFGQETHRLLEVSI